MFGEINWDAVADVKERDGRAFARPRLNASLHVDADIPPDMNISIVCDATVVKVFTGLLLNGGYAPVPQGEEEPIVDLRCEFYKERVVVILENACVETADAVVREARSRRRKWLALEELGGGVEYRESEPYRVTVRLVIPYAGFCKGGARNVEDGI